MEKFAELACVLPQTDLRVHMHREAMRSGDPQEPQAAAEGEKGQTDCNSGLVTGPEIGLPSGCFVGPELIEGESCVFE